MKLPEIAPVVPKTRLCRVIVETPRGSQHKYAFEPELNGFILKKTLPEGMVFPFDFGFVPRTKGGDGDPLDALVLADGRIFPGCIVPCRIIGLIKAKQREKGGKSERNDRLIAVADSSAQFADIKQPGDLPPHILDQTQKFFIHYNEMAGKRFTPIAVAGPGEAWRFLRARIADARGGD